MTMQVLMMLLLMVTWVCDNPKYNSQFIVLVASICGVNCKRVCVFMFASQFYPDRSRDYQSNQAGVIYSTVCFENAIQLEGTRSASFG